MAPAWTLGFIALAVGAVASFFIGGYPGSAIIIALVVWFMLLAFAGLIKVVNR